MLITQLLSDYNILYAQEGSRHYREGWINIACPFCAGGGSGKDGFHLGITEDGTIGNCWRCGVHGMEETISKLLNIPTNEARMLISEYGGHTITRRVERVLKIRSKAHKHPSGVVDLLLGHRNYLLKRNFDPDLLIREWKIQGTGPISLLEHLDFSRRIFIPILWANKEVSFQTRDITGKHHLKYITCPEDRELIKHKHIVYKHPDFTKDTCICTEGVTDVWRFGRNAIATFGIEYTRQQVRVISQLFKRVAVCFDDEIQAKRQADELVAELRFRKVDAWRVDIVGDPGGMDQKEADYIVKQIIH